MSTFKLFLKWNVNVQTLLVMEYFYSVFTMFLRKDLSTSSTTHQGLLQVA